MLEHFPRPIILAHRGDLTHAPENTLLAFQQAIQKGADGIELDAKLTHDGHVIVFHDMTVDRTTNGSGKVSTLKLNLLRELDAGSWFDEKFRGTQVPLLEEVFETVGKNKLINIELTNYSTPRDGLVDKVCELIKRHNNQEQIIFSSFFSSNLKRAAELLPSVPKGLLAMPGIAGIWARSFGFTFGEYQALHPHISSLTKEGVQRVHRLKRRVHVWTANLPEEILKLKEWGVDGFFTDDPAIAVQTLNQGK